METSPRAVVERIVEAQKDHDLEGMLEWIAPDYRTETPVHPERNFTGHDQVRETWETVFRTTPDFEGTLLNVVEDVDTVWTELRYSGTQIDETALLNSGGWLRKQRASRFVRG